MGSRLEAGNDVENRQGGNLLTTKSSEAETELLIPRPIHFSHPPNAEDFGDFVLSELGLLGTSVRGTQPAGDRP